MRIRYASFSCEDDHAEEPLKEYLADLKNEADTEQAIPVIRVFPTDDGSVL